MFSNMLLGHFWLKTTFKIIFKVDNSLKICLQEKVIIFTMFLKVLFKAHLKHGQIRFSDCDRPRRL